MALVPQDMQIEEDGHGNVRGYESNDFSTMEGVEEVIISVSSVCWLSNCLVLLGKRDWEQETEE